LIQFVIRRSRSFENSQIPIIKSLTPTQLAWPTRLACPMPVLRRQDESFGVGNAE
jgi:hypothetical protein